MADSSDPQDAVQPEGVFVVMHTAVGNFVRGCRVRIGDLYHPKLPGRDLHFRRLVDLGAIKPESDPEASALPETQPVSSAAPIIMAGAENNLTPMLQQRNRAWGITDPRDYPGARADSTALDLHADDAATRPPAPEVATQPVPTPEAPPATTVTRLDDGGDSTGQPATTRRRR